MRPVKWGGPIRSWRTTVIAIAATAIVLPGATSANPVPKPLAERINFWSPSEQESGYRAMETIFPANVIRAGGPVRALPVARTEMAVDFDFENKPYTIDDFMKANRVSGLLVLKKGKVMVERYGLGRGPMDRWTSFSIAKSVTSSLIGAALRDGKITSLDEPLTRYLPDLNDGAYEGVTIRQALQMRSGVGWKEDYYDPSSDFSRYTTGAGPAFHKLVSAMPRDAAPGEKFYYSTAESNLLGAVVIKATGKSLSDYLSEKIWKPFGMEADGIWITSAEGLDLGGICFSATLRDYGRFGQFMLEDGQAGGRPVFPQGWIAEATRTYSEKAYGDLGYGYQWWTSPDGSYRGIGIMGQALYIDPKRELVAVIQSAWTRAGGPQLYGLQWAFINAAAAASDRLNAAAR